MKFIYWLVSIIFLVLFQGNCISKKASTFKPLVVYKTSTLFITQIAANTYIHTSYKQTNDFGNVPCNGMFVTNSNEAIVFDTPTNDSSAAALITFISNTLQCNINAIIPTHFHDDCLGGLKAFHNKGIASYANIITIDSAKRNNYEVPKNGFRENLQLSVGKEKVAIQYFGQGHTTDNVIGYFAKDNVMFGGCLIKEINASKGYLGDANVLQWSNTVDKIIINYPNVKLVVPGHGKYGNSKLLNYTSNLFRVP